MKAIVFVLRGCPAGWLGAYGNEWVGTPNLDRLAAESVVFDRHVSDRPEPNAASAAWLGGTQPSGSRLNDRLRDANVRTVLVRANHPDTDGPDWFYAGWAEVFDARPQAEDKSPLEALIRALPQLLDQVAAGPDALLWIEIDRLLPPWDVPQDVFDAYLGADADDEDEKYGPDEVDEDDEEDDEEGTEDEDDEEGTEDEDDAAEVEEEDDAEEEPVASESPASKPQPTAPNPPPTIPPWFDPPTGPFDRSDPDAWEWLHNSFAAVVTALDAELGAIFDLLQARGFDQSATWLLTSDFGYPLGEHGQIGLHRPWLHTELVHLPLIVRLPGAAEACRRVPGFTQPPDLFPTLLDMFGVKPAEGISLLSLARGEAESTCSQVVTGLELNGAAELSIRTDDCAFLLPVKLPEGEVREPQLFDKPDDRWEVNDMRGRKIDHADQLEEELKKRGIAQIP